MSVETLGEFEQLVMVAVVQCERSGTSDVYGVPVMEEIERRTDRNISRAAVYVTLRRLEKKGLLASWMSEPRAERGGKARRCVRLTAAGAASLRESRRLMDRMWVGLDPATVSDRS